MVAPAQIEISIIGNVKASIDGRAVHIPRGRVRILLAALALEAGRPRAVTRLMEYLWGDDLPENPRTSLQNLVRRLRALLGPEAIRTFTEGYQLDVPADQIDLHRFLRLADELASRPAEDTHRRAALIESLQQLWQDEPLTDVGSSALAREYTPALFERYLAMVEVRADADIAAGHQTRAIGDLRELTARFPLHESLWSRLLRVLRDTGRAAEALDTYERLRATLADELGADPGPVLQALHHQLLTVNIPSRTDQPDDPPARLTSPAIQPEVDHEPEPPRQLPPEPAGFVGRSAETTRLDAILERCTLAVTERVNAPICLAVLHGPGGIGKTALATHWAHRVAADFPDGQLYIDLAGFGPHGAPIQPHQALGMLLRSLGVSSQHVPVRTAERTALFRTRVAGRRVLLVLDNALDEEQIRPLLPGSGAIVLITSRNRLRDLGIREGAIGVPLAEFPDSDARTLVEGVLGTERLAESEQKSVDDLIELCGGLPLALRIAAEMCSRYPQSALRDLITDLGKASDGASPVLAGVRTVLSWSYRALPAAAARLFRRLGRFPGPVIGVEAAAALLDQDQRETAALMDVLVAGHLVEEPRPGRYWLHDQTRAYAAECFVEEEPEAEQAATVRRLLDWYLHAVRQAHSLLGFSPAFPMIGNIDPPSHPLPVFADQSAASQWFETERLTVLAIVADAAKQGHDQHVWQFCRGMRDFLDTSSYMDDLLRLARLGLDSAERLEDPTAIGQAAFALGGAYNGICSWDEAERLLLHSLRYEQERGDLVRVTSILSVLGNNRAHAGARDLSIAYHEQAIETARRSGNDRALGQALLNSGGGAIDRGDLDKGIQQCSEALRPYTAEGRPLQRAIVMTNLATAYLHKDQLELAEEHAEQASAILHELGNRRHLGSNLVTLGHIYARSGRPDRAVESWRRVLTLINPDERRAKDARSALQQLSSSEADCAQRASAGSPQA